MTTTAKGLTVPSLDRFELSNKPTVIITEKLKRQIDWLHKKCGSIEWSGELITSEINTINDLDNWTIVCEDIYLVDVGTTGYTSYEVDKAGFKSADIIELYDAYPGLLDGSKKAQHIHTHHSMSAFFSGTDWSQLEDRGVLSNYFVMLIVNFDGKYVAKAAFKAQSSGSGDTNLNFANNLDGRQPLVLKGSAPKDMLVVMDCKIEFENTQPEIEQSFSDRYEAVNKAIQEEKLAARVYTPSYDRMYGGWGTPNRALKKWDQRSFDWQDDTPSYSPPKKGKKKKQEKSIMEMTDKEWEQYVNKDIEELSLKDAYYCLNTYLSNNYDATEYASPFQNVLEKGKDLKTDDDLEEFCLEFNQGQGFKTHFESLYPGRKSSEFIFVMESLCTYLKTYKNNKFANELITEMTGMIEEEIEENLLNAPDTPWYGLD